MNRESQYIIILTFGPRLRSPQMMDMRMYSNSDQCPSQMLRGTHPTQTSPPDTPFNLRQFAEILLRCNHLNKNFPGGSVVWKGLSEPELHCPEHDTVNFGIGLCRFSIDKQFGDNHRS